MNVASYCLKADYSSGEGNPLELNDQWRLGQVFLSSQHLLDLVRIWTNSHANVERALCFKLASRFNQTNLKILRETDIYVDKENPDCI